MDFMQRAKRVVDIATGQVDEPRKQPSAKARGGNARADALTATQRSEIARKAAQTRWQKHDAA